MIAEHLAASGVRLVTDPHVVPRTSSALATLQPDGSARYTFDIDWRIGAVEHRSTRRWPCTPARSARC